MPLFVYTSQQWKKSISLILLMEKPWVDVLSFNMPHTTKPAQEQLKEEASEHPEPARSQTDKTCAECGRTSSNHRNLTPQHTCLTRSTAKRLMPDTTGHP